MPRGKPSEYSESVWQRTPVDADRAPMSPRSTAAETAAVALRTLVGEEGWSAAVALFASAISEPMNVALSRARQEIGRRSNECAGPLSGQRHLGPRCPWHVRGADFSFLARRAGAGPVFVAEPFGIPWESLAALVDVCRAMGWQASVHGESPRFPGRTVRVEIESPRSVRKEQGSRTSGSDQGRKPPPEGPRPVLRELDDRLSASGSPKKAGDSPET